MEEYKIKKPFGIQIEGFVYAIDDEEIGNKQLLGAFIKFIENKGWSFGGGSYLIDQAGKRLMILIMFF